MTTFLQDIRYSLRALAKRPTYALVTILVLAIAIGANTTVFSVVNSLFLRSLPYPDGDRLVWIYNTYPGAGLIEADVSIPDYLDRRERAPSLESLALYTGAARALTTDGPPELLAVIRATPSFFDVLGIAPELGRPFTQAEATPGGGRVVVVSREFWSTHLGAQQDAVGGEIRLDGEAYRVVGVMPESFGFPNRDVDAWVPFAFTSAMTANDQRGMEYSSSIGRLRPGATLEQVNAEFDAIVQRNVEQGLERGSAADIEAVGFTGRARLLRDMLVGDLERMLWLLQAIVLAVLLIACANVANLQLARTAVRARELSMRAVLGAAQRRLAALVLVESALLAVVGAGCGLLVASAGLELVRALGLDGAPLGFDYTLDLRVLGFTTGATVLAALVAGLVPVAALLRGDLAQAIRNGGRRDGSGHASGPLRKTLVVAQIAMSVALLVGAGLLTRSFYALQHEDAGFDTGGLWTAQIALPTTRYEGAEVAAFYDRALEALGALPGVTEAGFTTSLPFSGDVSQGSLAIEEYTPPAGAAEPHSHQRNVSEGYLRALGIPVVRGRNFAARESEPVAIVDELMVRKYWPAGDVLGRRIRPAFEPADRWYTIVGVVPTVKHSTLAETPTKETVYWHYGERPRLAGQLVLRTTLPPGQLTQVARDTILSVDPDVPIFDVRSMDARVAASLGPQRAPMVLTLAFAGIAFTLAVVGVYSVLTWAVTQRFGEIGVRVALGAQTRDVLRMVLGEGGRLIAAGLALGAVIAVVLGRALASQMHEISPLDPAVLGTAFIGLTAAALVASWLPARRAARIDPMRALREE